MSAAGATRGHRGSLALPRLNVRMAVGLLLAVAIAAANVAFWQAGQVTTPVVVAARDLPSGYVITPADLAVVDARLEGELAAMALPEAERSFAVGRTTSAAIRGGALVLRPDLGVGPMIGEGEVAVTVPLRADEVYPGLRPGDRVAVVATGGDARVSPASETVLDEAIVYHVSLEPTRIRIGGGEGDAADGQPSNVTLVVPGDAAERLAQAIVAERVTLVLLGAPSSDGGTE